MQDEVDVMEGYRAREVERIHDRLNAADREVEAWKRLASENAAQLTDREKVIESMRQQLEGAVKALEQIERVYERTQPGPRDALRDRVLEIIERYRSNPGGR